jgi:hypothetical protein
MAKIKVSEIRAKFPMYDDLTDDQLISGIRQKFYSDIPIQKFAGMIEYDTQRRALGAEVTDEMGMGGRLLAGVGKGMTDVAQGIRQAVGGVSRQDVKDKRATDTALMDTGAGKWGAVAGNVAAMAPAVFIPGAATLGGAAAIGATTGALAPSESTEETLKNTALGAVIAPVANVAGRTLGAGAQAVRGLVQPFTKKGQDELAAATLRQFATDPAKAAANLRGARELVPGSAPTMAQAADDAGLAQLERTLVNNPETGGKLTEAYAAQRAARLGAVSDVAGNGAKREAAIAARQAAAAPAYQRATSASYIVDPVMAGLLERPVMQQAVQRATRLAQNSGAPAPIAQTPQGVAVTGRGLQDIKMALDDLLSDPMAGIGKNEAAAVKGVRQQFIDWMESANPAFKAARTTFAEKSTPINTMDVAQALMQKLEPALARYGASTKEHASAYAQALEAAKDTVKRQTGINKPIDEVIDAKALDILNNVAKDLARKAKAEDMGRAVGSNTAQNLAAQNLLRRTLGPTGLPQSWAESNAAQAFLSPYTGVVKLSGAENAIMARLADAAADPAQAANLLMMPQPTRINALVQPAMRYAPAASLGYSRQ